MIWVLISALHAAVPIILTAEAGLIAERSGIVNLALEGMMLTGAFVSMFAAHMAQNAWAGLVAGVAVGALLGLIHAYASITWSADQIISATGINVAAAGGTSFLLKTIFKHSGTSPAVPHIPKLFPSSVASISGVGGLLINLTFIDLFAYTLPFILLWFYSQTPWGLRVRSVGEKPEASESVGINVIKVRYVSTIISGAVAGLAGVYLVLGVLGFFQQDMSAGRGYLGLVAMIFGKWHPIGALLAAVFFGLTDAIQMSLQLNMGSVIPCELFLAMPYIMALAALGSFVGRASGPEAAGQPYTPPR